MQSLRCVAFETPRTLGQLGLQLRLDAYAMLPEKRGRENKDSEMTLI